MASILNKFEEKTKILASKVNQNFEFLQEDIATLTDSVDSKLSSNKESILDDIQTVKESLESGKLNTSLDNLDTAAFEKITNSLMPNYDAGVDIKSLKEYTIPNDGWVFARMRGDWTVSFGQILVNGKEVTNFYGFEGSRGSDNVWFPVGKDSILTKTTTNITCVFYPCKGEK
ncbi:MAG: hypothetical protein IKY15_02755 [Clostridia bacterium]|nr:hypothetical protein [Clostridia bacterium]